VSEAWEDEGFGAENEWDEEGPELEDEDEEALVPGELEDDADWGDEQDDEQ
jgi:hypothetical protein